MVRMPTQCVEKLLALPCLICLRRLDCSRSTGQCLVQGSRSTHGGAQMGSEKSRSALAFIVQQPFTLQWTCQS